MGCNMAEEKKQHDVFLANQIYPDAEKIFSDKLKPLSEIKDDCIVVLDTNSLLVPYLIGKESIDQIKHTYSYLVKEKRLIVPGQVAREFAKNRAKKIMELFQQLNRKYTYSTLHKGKYPILDSIEDYQIALNLEKEIDDKINDYKKMINSVMDQLRLWTWNDPVSLLYSELFNKDVVFDIEIDKEKIMKDLQYRQENDIPPGYKDASKEDLGIGDLLIWYSILEIGRKNKNSVIFVSGEEKPDWWYKSEGVTLYPRYELVDEFRRASSGNSFHILSFSKFLSLYGASKTVVQEIRAKEIETVVDYSNPNLDYQKINRNNSIQREIAGNSLKKWLYSNYSDFEIIEEPNYNLPFRPSFALIKKNGEIIAVEEIYIKDRLHLNFYVKRIMDKALAG
jgi:hypothetical protein